MGDNVSNIKSTKTHEQLGKATGYKLSHCDIYLDYPQIRKFILVSLLFYTTAIVLTFADNLPLGKSSFRDKAFTFIDVV